MKPISGTIITVLFCAFLCRGAADESHNSDHLMYLNSVSHGGISDNSHNCGGGISGMVKNLNYNGGDSSAVVIAYPADSSITGGREPGKGYAIVDRDGSYLVENLCKGYYYVMTEAPGYEMLYWPDAAGMYGAKTVFVNDEDVTGGIDFEMRNIVPGTSKLRGTVQSAAGQTPIEGATVFLFSNENPHLNRWTSTNASGEYRFDGLKSGVCYVRAFTEGHIEQYYDRAQKFEDAKPICISEPDSITNINFELFVGGSISGRIVDPAGHPVPEVYLYAMQFGFDSLIVEDPDEKPCIIGEHGKAVSNMDGYYSITGLSSGDYFVLAEYWNQWSSTSLWYENVRNPAEARPVSVTMGEDTPDINFQMSSEAPDGEINGHVLNLDGEPVQDAVITVQSFKKYEAMDFVWRSVVTDTAGYYQVKGLRDGQYLLSLVIENGRQPVFKWWPDAETMEDAEPIWIDETGGPVTADFKVAMTSSQSVIAGKVVDELSNPISGASIRIVTQKNEPDKGRSQFRAYSLTDSAGQYRVEKLPKGAYLAEASFWRNDSVGYQWYDHKNDMENATVIELGESEIIGGIHFTLSMQPVYGRITGTVMDSAGGMPIERAYVSVQPTFFDHNMYMRPFFHRSVGAITDRNGQFIVDRLFAGEYILSVYADNAFEYFENTTDRENARHLLILGGDEKTANFDLVPQNNGPGIISGKVVSQSTGQPFEFAVLTATLVDMQTLVPLSDIKYIAVAAENGDYTIEGLPAGDFVVSAFSQRGIEQYYKDVFDPSRAQTISVDGEKTVTGVDFELVEVWLCDFDSREGKVNAVSVVGNISDQNQEGIEGALVYIFTETGIPVASTRADAGGNYEFAGLAPGSYIIQAGHPGYITLFNGNVQSRELVTPVQIGAGLHEFNFILSLQSGTVVGHSAPKVPDRLELYQNYPNPYNPETTIAFDLPEARHAKLTVYNINGKTIRILHDGKTGVGQHKVVWDSRSDTGRRVSSGVYFYKLVTPNQVLVRKMVLLR